MASNNHHPSSNGPPGNGSNGRGGYGYKGKKGRGGYNNGNSNAYLNSNSSGNAYGNGYNNSNNWRTPSYGMPSYGAPNYGPRSVSDGRPHPHPHGYPQGPPGPWGMQYGSAYPMPQNMGNLPLMPSVQNTNPAVAMGVQPCSVPSEYAVQSRIPSHATSPAPKASITTPTLSIAMSSPHPTPTNLTEKVEALKAPQVAKATSHAGGDTPQADGVEPARSHGTTAADGDGAIVKPPSQLIAGQQPKTYRPNKPNMPIPRPPPQEGLRYEFSPKEGQTLPIDELPQKIQNLFGNVGQEPLPDISGLDGDIAADLRQILISARAHREEQETDNMAHRQTILQRLLEARYNEEKHEQSVRHCYARFMEKMASACQDFGDSKEATQRQAIQYLKSATAASSHATKYREAIEKCRYHLLHLDNRRVITTNAYAESVQGVLVKILDQVAVAKEDGASGAPIAKPADTAAPASNDSPNKTDPTGPSRGEHVSPASTQQNAQQSVIEQNSELAQPSIDEVLGRMESMAAGMNQGQRSDNDKPLAQEEQRMPEEVPPTTQSKPVKNSEQQPGAKQGRKKKGKTAGQEPKSNPPPQATSQGQKNGPSQGPTQQAGTLKPQNGAIATQEPKSNPPPQATSKSQKNMPSQGPSQHTDVPKPQNGANGTQEPNSNPSPQAMSKSQKNMPSQGPKQHVDMPQPLNGATPAQVPKSTPSQATSESQKNVDPKPSQGPEQQVGPKKTQKDEGIKDQEPKWKAEHFPQLAPQNIVERPYDVLEQQAGPKNPQKNGAIKGQEQKSKPPQAMSTPENKVERPYHVPEQQTKKNGTATDKEPKSKPDAAAAHKSEPAPELPESEIPHPCVQRILAEKANSQIAPKVEKATSGPEKPPQSTPKPQEEGKPLENRGVAPVRYENELHTFMTDDPLKPGKKTLAILVNGVAVTDPDFIAHMLRSEQERKDQLAKGGAQDGAKAENGAKTEDGAKPRNDSKAEKVVKALGKLDNILKTQDTTETTKNPPNEPKGTWKQQKNKKKKNKKYIAFGDDFDGAGNARGEGGSEEARKGG
jgi:hypothetical protein